MTSDQSIASKVKQEFTQIYLILVQALNVIKSEKREICTECHKNVQWELEPKYYFDRHEDPLIGLPDWLCPNPQVRAYISRRIMMVYDTLYFLESALIKFQKPFNHKTELYKFVAKSFLDLKANILPSFQKSMFYFTCQKLM